MGGSTSHVANGSSETIYCKCLDIPQQFDLKVEANAEKDKIGKVFGKVDYNDKTSHIKAGYVAIAPGDYLGFHSKSPHISIKTVSRGVIARNYNPGRDVSVIVTPEYTLMRTVYGKIWLGRNGRQYGEKHWGKTPEKRYQFDQKNA